MYIQETSPKLKAAITLAKIRGYKELREEQVTLLRELLSLDELTVTEAVNEVLDAPKERIERTINASRSIAAKGLTRLAAIINAK
jgi:hypothetical protein